MKSLHTEISIGAPASLVWDVISDLEGWAEWNPVMKASGNLVPGGRLEITIAAPGSQGLSFNPKIIILEDGREFRWRFRKYFGLFDAEHGFRVVMEDTEQCRFEQFESFRGMLGGAMYKRQSKALDTGFQIMNRMLKREAEKRARENS